MKLSNRKKLAIIGCGAVTQNFYIPALKALKVKPLYFIDKNIDSAKKCAKKFSGSIAAHSYEDIIENFEHAIITVPNALHYPISIELMNHQKNLLIEKPIGITANESKEINLLTKKNNLSIVCGNMRRQLRIASFVKKIIMQKTLGEIISFKCREGGIFNWPIQSENFWDKKNSGGGVLLDTGSHTIEQILFYFGFPNKIKYYDNSIDNIESDCYLELEFEKFQGSLQLSRTLGLDSKMYIKFSNGDIIFDLVGNKLDIECSSELKKLIGLENFNQKNQSYDELIAQQINEWYKYIEGNKSANVVTTEDAHNVMKFIDYCYNNKLDMEF